MGGFAAAPQLSMQLASTPKDLAMNHFQNTPEPHTTPRPLLNGLTIVPPEDEADALNDRIDQWTSSLKPFDLYETWLVHEVAHNTLILERLHQREIVLRNDHAKRSTVAFDQHQRDHAELLAAGLSRHPARALFALRKFAQGCLAIARRWQMLLATLVKNREWTAPQRLRALNLLNVPPEFRDGVTPLDPPDDDNDPDTLFDHLHQLAETEIQRHHELAALLQPLDERQKEATRLGLGPDTPELVALRKEQRQAERRLAWTRSQFKTSRPDPRPIDRGDLPAYIPGEYDHSVNPSRRISWPAGTAPTPVRPTPTPAATASWTTPRPEPIGPALNDPPHPKPHAPEPTRATPKPRRRRA